MNAYYLLGAVSSIAVSMSENRHKEEKERLALCLAYSIIVAVARVIAVRNWVFAWRNRPNPRFRYPPNDVSHTASSEV